MSQVQSVVDATRKFVQDEVLPLDDEFDGDIEAAGGDEARRRLQAAARDAGLLSPHGPEEYGGLGLNMTDRAPVFEEAGYSRFGTVARHLTATAQGTVQLQDCSATAAQRVPH